MPSKSAYTVLASALGVGALGLAVIGVISGWALAFTLLVVVTVLLYTIATIRHMLGAMPMARPA
jgi:hypothetical protein